SRVVRPIPVTREDMRTTHLKLADLTCWQKLPVLDLHHTHLHTRKRAANGARPPLAIIRVGQIHDGLCHAIALEDALPKHALELGKELWTERRRPGNVKAQWARSDTPLSSLRQQTGIHRWHTKEEADRCITLDSGEYLSSLEPAVEHGTCPKVQGPMQADHQTVRVKQRQRQQKSVANGPAPGRGNRRDIGHLIAVQQQCTLRSTRRSPGVRD